MNPLDRRCLKGRYLLWLYKTTREELERIERKFTQLEIDNFLLKELCAGKAGENYRSFIDEFRAYVEKKQREGARLKFAAGGLKPEYAFLAAKLKAIEKAIAKTLGRPRLAEIKSLYELEMRRRILESHDH